MRLSNRRCYYRNDKNAAASSKVQSIQPEECVGLTAGSGAVETAPATALTNSTRARMPRPRTCRGLTCHFHIRVIKVNRARRARSPTRRGGLAAAARATCAHLSPPPHHQEPDGTPKQNGQQRTCRECSRRHRSQPYIDEGRLGPGSLLCLLGATPDSRARPNSQNPVPIDRLLDLRACARTVNNALLSLFSWQNRQNESANTAHFDYERAVQNANAVSDEIKTKNLLTQKATVVTC